MSPNADDPLSIQGKPMGGARASIASGIRPTFFRLVTCDPAFRITFLFSLSVLLTDALVIWGGFFLAGLGGWPFQVCGYLVVAAGLVIGFFGLLFGSMLPLGFIKDVELYENGLLSPGVILSREPLVLVVMASMGNGSGTDYYGIGRMDLTQLPYHDQEKWTRVPCVCGFMRGHTPDRWGGFRCEPMSYATGKKQDIERCFQRLGQEPFVRLESYLRNGKLPESKNQIILLDSQLNYLETIDTEEASKVNKEIRESEVATDSIES